MARNPHVAGSDAISQMLGIFCFLTLVGTFTALSSHSSAWAADLAGQRAPTLTVPEMDGAKFDLAALRGNVVLVNFWATWCAPCREELPALNAFYQRFHDRGVTLIGISGDSARDIGDVRKTMHELSYPVVMLRDASENGFGAPRSHPVTHFIDGAGQVRAELRPDADPVAEASLEKIVLPLLSSR